MRATVVFHGQGNHWLAPLLRPGFSHVAVAVRVDARWVLIDPGTGTPDIRAIDIEDFAASCRQLGWTALETETRDIEAAGPFMLNTCVGVVKKVLGIRNPLIVTPYQIYRHLTEEAACSP